ncbi:MAG: hypothetical protein K2X29_02270 [Candidatus Obscuribacterales bacterium]|nr:hypothetical protein [Candidatus Obscuribacterales bacterium]
MMKLSYEWVCGFHDGLARADKHAQDPVKMNKTVTSGYIDKTATCHSADLRNCGRGLIREWHRTRLVSGQERIFGRKKRTAKIPE